jgi:hypothetical protein
MVPYPEQCCAGFLEVPQKRPKKGLKTQGFGLKSRVFRAVFGPFLRPLSRTQSIEIGG